MIRIPPVHQARSFLLTLEHNVLTDIDRLEDTGFWGSRASNVVENIFVDWIQHSAAELDSKYGLNFQEAIELGYSANLHCKQPKIIVPYGQVVVRFCGKPRYFIERLAMTEPLSDIPNQFYQKSSETIITCVLTQRIPKFIAQAKRQGAIDEGEFGTDHEGSYN